jgi:hypothetical protein
MNPFYALLPVVFGVADYITGRDFLAKLKLPGRSIWWVTPPLCLGLWLMDHRLAAVGIAWALWRSVLGWSSFGGALNPKTTSQGLGLFLRNLVSSIPVVLALVFGLHVFWLVGIAAMVAFCIWATALNFWLTSEATHGRDADPTVDALHGIGFGSMLVILGWLA